MTANVSEQDLTTRARIRQAALLEFTEHGFRGASIRGIARAAGVSPGLVQHHFGTKDGLREACDEYVMDFMRSAQERFAARGASPSPDLLAGQLGELQPILDYLITSLSSGSETAGRWFEEITEYTYEALTSGRIGPALTPGLEARSIAATQAAMALGVAAFYRHIQRAVGVDDETELMLRVGRARLFLASDRIIDDATREQITQALDQYEQSMTTGKPPPRQEPDKQEN